MPLQTSSISVFVSTLSIWKPQKGYNDFHFGSDIYVQASTELQLKGTVCTVHTCITIECGFSETLRCFFRCKTPHLFQIVHIAYSCYTHLFQLTCHMLRNVTGGFWSVVHIWSLVQFGHVYPQVVLYCSWVVHSGWHGQSLAHLWGDIRVCRLSCRDRQVLMRGLQSDVSFSFVI